MKKGCMFIVALVFGVLSHNAAFAADYGVPANNNAPMRDVREVGPSSDGYYAPGQVDPNCEYRSGPCTCYCPVTKYKPCYYTEKHCVKEPYCEYKRCCRYVPQYCEKQCCRYVPQYYSKTYCKYVPEYYSVPVQKCRERIVCEQKCRYVPCTYMKKMCIECPTQAPCAQPACAPACAPSCEPACGDFNNDGLCPRR